MVQVGQTIPDFRIECVQAGQEQAFWINSREGRGEWWALLFYPRDFSFVCPTELASFSDHSSEFAALRCRLLGISVDSLDSHREWLRKPISEGGLEGLRFPLGTDQEGRIARQLGVWNEPQHLANRGLLLVDPQGRLQYSVVHNLHVGRSVEETLRVLRALQSGGLCPASWNSETSNLDAEALLQPGRVLGHYRLRDPLGTGSFGTVFSAWDLRLERWVAIKVLKRVHAQSREALLDEARAAASISHPYVCTIHSVEELDHLSVIVMRYVEGGSLADRLIEGSLTPDQARAMVRRIAEGLAAAHERGVVHGDLKPANILIDSQGLPCIVDFGMSRGRSVVQAGSGRAPVDEVELLETAPTATATWRVPIAAGPLQDPDLTHAVADTNSWRAASRTLFGTPAYMSPEQAEGQIPGPMSDIFSLGLILAEMIDGRRVLDETNVIELLRVLRSGQITSRIESRLGERFPKSCLMMLRRDPGDRPTARQVVAALG